MQLEGREESWAHPERAVGQPEGDENQPAEYKSQPEGTEMQMDIRTNGQKDKRNMSPLNRNLSPRRAAARKLQ